MKENKTELEFIASDKKNVKKVKIKKVKNKKVKVKKVKVKKVNDGKVKVKNIVPFAIERGGYIFKGNKVTTIKGPISPEIKACTNLVILKE